MGPRLSHLFVHARDLEAMRQFYVDQLGLEVLMEEDGYLRIGGGGGFHMGLEKVPKGQPFEGIEINIEVPDVDAVHARLSRQGLSFEGPPADTEWGVREVWLRDPSGYKIGLYSPQRSTRQAG